jgi:5-methylcytosine-specific restriction endonuclease McrA
MNRAQRPRLRLDPQVYEALRQQVLRRDGWKCQSCGAMSNLEVHHQKFRSQLGADSEQNLITLCTRCHEQVHRNRQGMKVTGRVDSGPDWGA